LGPDFFEGKLGLLFVVDVEVGKFLPGFNEAAEDFEVGKRAVPTGLGIINGTVPGTDVPG
jgi:hypothetical protein